ncbi:MAG: hypothetical protein ACR2LI_02470 [Propionibacteriaceae bacterium]
MISELAYGVIALAVLVLGWGLLTAIAKRPISWAQLIGVGVLELATLVQSVVAGVRLVAGFRPTETGTTIGYLIAIVVLLPLGTVWALTDRSRFAGVVLAVAAASVGAMTLRLLNLWGVLG